MLLATRKTKKALLRRLADMHEMFEALRLNAYMNVSVGDAELKEMKAVEADHVTCLARAIAGEDGITYMRDWLLHHKGERTNDKEETCE